MSRPADDNPTLRRQLLSGMQRLRSLVEPEGAALPCDPVDWRQPHRLNTASAELLRLFAAKLAMGLTKGLEALTGQPFNASVVSLCERYAASLYEQVEQERPTQYYLPLTAAGGKGHVGFLRMSLETAGLLVGYVLRDPEAQIGKSERISPLGETILLDAVAALADALEAGFAEYGQARLEKTEHLIYRDWPVRFNDLEDLCEFNFCAVCGQAELSITLILLDEIVAPIVGLTGPFGRAEEKKDNPDRIVKRMYDAPMTVAALLSDTLMTLNDVMTLAAGDVIVLDRKITEPLDVQVNGQRCFTAWPAVVNGRYALAAAETKNR